MADEEENRLTTQEGAAPQQHGSDSLETLVQQNPASTETGCASVPCKQFDAQSCQVLPEEIVQVVVGGGGGGGEATQAVSTLADGAGGLFNANGIINSLAEAPPVTGTVAAVGAGDFTVAAEELESISIESTPSTIIYVQPDGTFVEGTGLTPEEQQQLVEQLAKQQGLVEVSEGEAAQMFSSHQQEHAQFVQHVGLTDDLQQVIAHVTKSQQQATQFSKNNVVQLNSETAENQILQKTSFASYVPPETRVLSTDQHQMLQVPECNATMQQVHASVHPSQTEKVTLARHFPGRRRTVRRGRPPKHHNNTYHQEQILKRKARIKELLKQCDDEELMELALPRLTKVITLWEFLLMKVEKGRPARPQFSDVYREFEMLHKHVKKMADEHLSNSNRMINPQQPLQISCTQVAESLGITEYTNKENQQDASVSLTYRLVTVDDQNHLNSSGEKHSMERDFGTLSPSSKRMKIDDSVTVTENNFNQNGIEITGEVQLQSLTTEEGQKQTECPTLNSCGAQTMYGPADDQVFDKRTDDGVLVSENNIKHSSSVEQSTSEELCYPVSQVTLSSTQLPLLEQHNEVLNNTIEGQDDFLAMDADITAEELVQEQLSYQSIPEQLNDTELTSTAQSEDEMTGQNSLLSDVAKGNQKGSEASNSVQILQHQLGNQDPLGNPEQAEHLNDSDIADQMQQLEKALSQDVEVCSSESNNLQQHQPEQTFEADLSTEVDLASQVSHEELNGLQVVNHNKIIGHFEQSTDQSNQESSEDILASTVTEDGALEFQLPVGSQELLAQGHEQIFIQTSEGLIVSHEGTAVVSQTSEGIVIVTNADGTTMHIRTPDGVPFETVEALLAMDSEGQSEGLLVTQTPTEVEQ
ncbi:hypothetical protein chiPu_0003770 [Chiloscyllium punctatum]|uniref:DUF4764 domain-containing protein n=1 Tax=Chiloscyllium punctatum TaxID=137246 RepID=A0A401S4N2_CHIPU|nr:hypothetical protein [Chiloscyllium punctatum]